MTNWWALLLLETFQNNMQKVLEIENQIELKRILFHADSKKTGPTVVFFAGIHGNEPAGIYALQELANDINKNINKGQCYGILGNIPALEKKQRFLDVDLNRLWTPKQIRQLENGSQLLVDQKQQKELFDLINQILRQSKGPYYFIDLHTTSSESPPFITINDALINRKFSEQFPVATVLGIEEFLSGPLLSYINSLGYVSLGFEAGQHNSHDSIENCKAFISLVIKTAGVVKKNALIFKGAAFNILQNRCKNIDHLFEVMYTEKLNENDHYTMAQGYASFQLVANGEVLGTKNGIEIASPSFGRIFMPLYQKQGSEAFFIIRTIPKLFFWLSVKLRPLKLDGLMPLLPGISWKDKKKDCLMINTKIAFLFPREIFHLFGYRQKQLDDNRILAYNRERIAKTKMYKNENWFK